MYPLGDSSLRFTAVYAVNGAIQTSDARQKTNIQNSDLGLDFINKLRPVFYNWKSGPDSVIHYGLIAQETEKVVNESRNRNDNTVTPIVDRDEKTGRYGLRYTELISPIIKAIQELYNSLVNIKNEQGQQSREIATKADSATVEALEAKSDKLEAENIQLKQQNEAIKTYLCSQNPAAPFCK